MSYRTIAVMLSFTLAATGCASTGATFRSGVGDAFLEHPPYYAPKAGVPGGAESARVGILPVLFQQGAAQAGIFDPKGGEDSPLSELLAEMNAYAESLTVANGSAPVRLAAGDRVSSVAPTSMGVPPDVRFGCITEGDLPGEDCVERGDSVLGRQGQRMKLAVGRPSPEWVSWAAGAMRAHDVSHTIVLTLEVGQYLPRQTGFVGAKSIELGTSHKAGLPWLTSLETPVQVLQITGALVDLEGRAVRIGAEGILAKRTRLLVSSLGAQELVSDEDLQVLRTRRRDELPGRPLVWREAMRQIVHQLTR